MKRINEYLLHNKINYTRYNFSKPLWINDTHNFIVNELTARELEKEYQKTLIPTKTSNIGGTPEVDNTEGQTLIEDNLLYILRHHTKQPYPMNSIGEAKLFDEIINLLKSKPVETTKKKPKICECCKRAIATTAKNMCKTCSQYW